jgi:hypothetical protein
MKLAFGKAAMLALLAPLVMGISDCSNTKPQIGAEIGKVKPTPVPTETPTGLPTGIVDPPTPVASGSCDRVEYFKFVQEPCLLPGGASGVSVWKMHCYSDGVFNPMTGSCASNGQREYCDPNPASVSACQGPPQTEPNLPGGSDDNPLRRD